MRKLLLSSLAQPFQGNLSMYGGVPLPQSQVGYVKPVECACKCDCDKYEAAIWLHAFALSCSLTYSLLVLAGDI